MPLFGWFLSLSYLFYRWINFILNLDQKRLGNCIGYENFHHFLQVLVNGALASLAVLIFIILNMFYFSKKTNIHSELSTKQHFFYTFQNPLWNLFCGLSGFFLLSLVGMMINFLELFLQVNFFLKYFFILEIFFEFYQIN